MDKEFEKILRRVQQRQPLTKTKTLEQSFDFISRQAGEYTNQQRKQILTSAYKIAHNYSLRPIKPAVLAVFVLNTLASEDKNLLEKVKTAFPAYTFKMLKAYRLAIEHLKDPIYERDSLDHTLNTTLLLSELKMGHQAICASFLKHLPDCSPISLEVIKKDFGQEIHDIIVNVHQLKHITTITKQRDTKHLRQMFLAMSKELRAIILKMCSLVDWVKNLDDVPESEKERMAIEAMDIYAPIADFLGMWSIKWQLEDFAFRQLNPQQYSKIEKRFYIDEKKNREKYIEKTKRLVLKEAAKKGINCSMNGRFKHFYSIHKKMQNKKKAFNEIYDVFALTVVVDSIDDCYRMFGIIHSIWKAKPRRVKDYISCPKSNNYRSLHTTVSGINNRMTEFQIRTKEMDEEANYGVAAHWYYKNKKEKTPAWIKKLLHEQMNVKNQNEFLEKVNTEVLINKIFVYTPKGDVISLPKGSTPVDFAYHIHTDVGHKCKAVLINGRPGSLDHKLKTRDTVEIIVNNKQFIPEKKWLGYVKSHLARRAIEQALEEAEDSITV